ncbi:MAG: exosortase family protein XrtG [Levilactobacillus sp.]|jgi:exosortase family protein XrtG|uniref:Exosortase family protein XrtG n=1 Tax=Levilactobacillus suantsaiihabitans TaxID=2487722 RepID=A0A4Z0JCA3_9LACO|nr:MULTISPECIES: exosortase family protein XrtG [Levilactobacillus]MCI1553090.1 exosortase family protein XrtG [Levilactobacillus sp.]MCI1598745.1 exosortase family protein XrtG [Levilactobacillus sp.]MCI1605094.1 exosortase family protein XrtG [Levilactobacillus sp.]TGD20461.1 exosortase family protein XrtG [Levilactobacillus suantsaiihabitans]
MKISILIGTVVWLYALSVLKRARLSAYFFIVGSAGLFFILSAISRPYWVWFFTHAVIHGVALFHDLTGWCTIMYNTGLVYITNGANPVIMSIDYECSGIIETCAFVALVVFFPMYQRKEKVFYALFGLVYIYAINVIRLCLVIIIVHFGGGQTFFIAHSIVGRLVFYVLVIALYYNVFTYSQLAHGIYREFIDWRQDKL